jgi:hypothetical protein
MVNSKYFNFIYLEWDKTNNNFIYTKNNESSLIKMWITESFENPIILKCFTPECYIDINKKNYNYCHLKKYTNCHMKQFKNILDKDPNFKNKYSLINRSDINDDYILNWLSNNLDAIIENEIYTYLYDIERYTKKRSFQYYIALTYILTHCDYSQIEADIKIFANTLFFSTYLNTNYRFKSCNLNINYKVPTIGNIIIPYKYYTMEETRNYAPIYLKNIKCIVDKTKYNKYNKFKKLLRIFINLLFSSINVIILVLYLTLCYIINKYNGTQFISYNYYSK